MMFKRIIAIFISIMIIQGCQSTGKASSIDDYKSNRDKSGLVVLSVTANTGEVQQIGSVVVVSTDERNRKQHIFDNKIYGKSKSTSLFFGGLPAGEYKIKSLISYGTGMSYTWDYEDKPIPGNFIVQAGKVSDLGRVVFSAVHDGAAIGRSRHILDNSNLLSKFYANEPELKENANNSSWAQPHLTIDMTEEYALKHPIGTSSLSELDDGTIIAGTRMGMALVRSKEGRWSRLAKTKDINRIITTGKYAQNEYLAVIADDQGTSYFIKEDGKLETMNRGNLPEGLITFITSSEDYKQWFIAVENEGYSELYSSNRIDNGIWKLEKRAEIGFDAWSGQKLAHYWRRPNGLGYASSEVESISCYDFSRKSWEESSTPDERVVIKVSVNPANEYIGILSSPGGGLGGVFAKTHYSEDCGKTWMETDSPYSVKVSPPLIVEKGIIIESGGMFSDEGLYISEDSGKSWNKAMDGKSISSNLIMTKNNGLFLISSGVYGFEMIENSIDYGKTWKLESSNYTPLVD